MNRRHHLSIASAVLAAIVACSALPAEATGPIAPRGRAAVRVQQRQATPQSASPQHRLVPGNPAAGSDHNFGPSYPFGRNYTGPSYPFGRNYTGPSYPFGNNYTAPAIVEPAPAPPPQRRWMNGYWAQQWVPQTYVYDAWVPGYFTRSGRWVQGYYEQRVAESGGYYERVWVDGYWTE